MLIFVPFMSACTACFYSGLPLARLRSTQGHTHTDTMQVRRRNWFLNALNMLIGAWWEEWTSRCEHLAWFQADFGVGASSFPAQTSKSRSMSYLVYFFLSRCLIMSTSIYLYSLFLSLSFVHIDMVNSAVDSFVSRQPENGSLPQSLSYTSTPDIGSPHLIV